MFLMSWEVKKWTQHFKCVSPVLSRGRCHLSHFSTGVVAHRAPEAVTLLCHMSALLAKRLNCPPGPQFLHARLLSSWLFANSQCVLVSGDFLPRSWTLCFPFLNFRDCFTFPVAHFSSTVWISLSGSTTIWYISHSFQFSTVYNFAEGALCLFCG